MNKALKKVLFSIVMCGFVLGYGISSQATAEVSEAYVNEINPDLLNKKIAAWDESAVYTSGDFTLYQDKIYSAKYWSQGNVPGTDEWGPWVEELNLNPESSITTEPEETNIDMSYNESSDRTRLVVNVPIVAVNASTTKSKYTYTLRACAPSGMWTAGVYSAVHYEFDNKKFVIVRIDGYSNLNLRYNRSVTKYYSYSNINKVVILVVGTWNGGVAPSRGGTIYAK